MTQKKLLVGSLSNDLYRIANLVYHGSYTAADKFFTEAQRWLKDLQKAKVKAYIRKILDDLSNETGDIHTMEKAEKFLMYSTLLQNYALHIK